MTMFQFVRSARLRLVMLHNVKRIKGGGEIDIRNSQCWGETISNMNPIVQALFIILY